MSKFLKALPDEPSLRVDALRLWVLGREFPDSHDSWDGNWLRIVAVCAGTGSRVEVSGPVLDTVSFASFLKQVQAMEFSLSGSAELSSVEPELNLTLKYADSLGHIKGDLAITGDQLRERHSFTLSLDQTHLLEIVKQLQAIMLEFPVRGARARDA